MRDLAQVDGAILRYCGERAKLAAWLARKESQEWDAQMDADSASGKLDFLFNDADAERKSGKLKDWPSSK